MYCVYRHVDKNGVLLYVGCCREVEERTAQHKYSSKWFNRISAIHVQHFSTREEAAAVEKRLISTLSPIHNVRFNPNGPKSRDMKYLRYLEKCESRNKDIKALRMKGWTLAKIATKFKVTRQRVHRIVSNGG